MKESNSIGVPLACGAAEAVGFGSSARSGIPKERSTRQQANRVGMLDVPGGRASDSRKFQSNQGYSLAVGPLIPYG